MKSLRRFCFALAFTLSACTPALADPALWVAKSATATVYLFGTVHVLPKDAKWHYPALDKALADSGTLYMEEDDDDPVGMQMLVLQYGMDLQHPLSKQLDDADRARLDAAAEAIDVPGGAATLNAMKPWLAALTITVAPIVKAGYDPKSGADKQLQRAFKAAGKTVDAFETAEQQIQYFANLPSALQLDLLRNVLDDYAKGPEQIKALIRAWQSGDVDAIASNVNGSMRQQYPELYEVLLVDRNRNFAKQIETLLKGDGTIFVAIGAGHLAGPDSVQTQLAKLGTETERVH
ncbi:MAG TPA: TraB/GumN family protein [Rhodanobacteraceae bacterium]|nr:TraB/GumN family protein [Rhodanobacteraceae bacterium]